MAKERQARPAGLSLSLIDSVPPQGSRDLIALVTRLLPFCFWLCAFADRICEGQAERCKRICAGQLVEGAVGGLLVSAPLRGSASNQAMVPDVER